MIYDYNCPTSWHLFGYFFYDLHTNLRKTVTSLQLKKHILIEIYMIFKYSRSLRPSFSDFDSEQNERLQRNTNPTNKRQLLVRPSRISFSYVRLAQFFHYTNSWMLNYVACIRRRIFLMQCKFVFICFFFHFHKYNVTFRNSPAKEWYGNLIINWVYNTVIKLYNYYIIQFVSICTET
jgi:hypothetical protein